MKQVDNKLISETHTQSRKILDFLMGVAGSLIIGNIGIVLLAQFDTPERLWILYFTWVWRLALAGLAVFLFTRKRMWISIGIVIAIYIQAFGI